MKEEHHYHRAGGISSHTHTHTAWDICTKHDSYMEIQMIAVVNANDLFLYLGFDR